MDRLIPIVSNEWYHVYNRGNDRRTLFHNAADYDAFLEKLENTLVRYSVVRIVYALMPNHYHMVLMQRQGGNLPRMMDAIGTSYAKRYNIRYGHSGHVFEGRYRYSHIPTEQSLLVVARYIHLNPVRARLVTRPEDWRYSDFKDYRDQGVLHPDLRKAEGRLEQDYASFVGEGGSDIDALRRLLFEWEARGPEVKASFSKG